MDYRRTYWLLFLGAAVIFGLLTYLDYREVGSTTPLITVSALVVLVIVGITAYAARYPDRVGGPDELNTRFAIALVAFVLFLGLAVVRLAGL